MPSPASTMPTRHDRTSAAARSASTASTSDAGTAASSPPDVCGSWASATSAGGDIGADVERRRREPAVVGRAAGLDAGRGELERAVERRQRRRIEDEPSAGGACHLEAVAEEPEPGDVGRAPDAVRDEHLGRGPVERPHLLDRGLEVGVRRPAAAPPAHEQAGPEPLRQQQHVARPRAALPQQPVGWAAPMTASPYFGSGSRIVWPPASVPPASRTFAAAAVEDRGQHVPRQVLGERRDRQREQHPAAHREHVATARWPRRSRRKRPRVVDERREEVERADDREVVAHPVDGGVVGRLEAGDQLVARRRRRARAEPRRGLRRAGPPRASRHSRRSRSARSGGSGRARRVGTRLPCRNHRQPVEWAASRPVRSRGSGSGGVPVGPPVFKTGGAALGVGAVGSTPMRSRHPPIEHREKRDEWFGGCGRHTLVSAAI